MILRCQKLCLLSKFIIKITVIYQHLLFARCFTVFVYNNWTLISSLFSYSPLPIIPFASAEHRYSTLYWRITIVDIKMNKIFLCFQILYLWKWPYCYLIQTTKYLSARFKEVKLICHEHLLNVKHILQIDRLVYKGTVIVPRRALK